MLSKVVVFVCVAAVAVHGYGSGAPESAEICNDLTPKHPGSPQTDPSPYQVVLSKDTVKSGETVQVSLRSIDDETSFKGFIVQARKFNYMKETTPVSRFLVENSPDYRPLNCGDDNNSITHASPAAKKNVQLKWVAPEDKGTYVMLATFVKDGKTYWVQQPSTTNVTVV